MFLDHLWDPWTILFFWGSTRSSSNEKYKISICHQVFGKVHSICFLTSLQYLTKQMIEMFVTYIAAYLCLYYYNFKSYSFEICSWVFHPALDLHLYTLSLHKVCVHHIFVFQPGEQVRFSKSVSADTENLPFLQCFAVVPAEAFQ